MKTSVRVSGDNYEVAGAILVYRQNRLHGYSGNQAKAFATIHDVSVTEHQPVIRSGRPLNEVDFSVLMNELAPKDRPQVEWQDHSVLAKGLGRTVWWTPPMKRAMFFSKSSHSSKSFKAQGMCPVPGMVWVAVLNDLYVYSFLGKDMPTQGTQLYQAPIMNVWASGKVCHGNAKAPDDEKKGDTKAWEKFLFGSRFTHPNFTEKDRLIDGVEPVSFWKKMVEKPTASFPEKRLVKIGLTVGSLLEPEFVTKVSDMTAEGEF